MREDQGYTSISPAKEKVSPFTRVVCTDVFSLPPESHVKLNTYLAALHPSILHCTQKCANLLPPSFHPNPPFLNISIPASFPHPNFPANR